MRSEIADLRAALDAKQQALEAAHARQLELESPPVSQPVGAVVADRPGSDFRKCLRSFAMRVAEEGIKDGSGRTMSIASDRCRAVANGVMEWEIGKGLIYDLLLAAQTDLATQPAKPADVGGQFDWIKAERIRDEDHVDEALRAFCEDPTADNATGVIQAALTVWNADAAALAAQPAAPGVKPHDASCWQNFKHADDPSSHCDCSLGAPQPVDSTAGVKPLAYAIYSCAGIHRLHGVKPIKNDEWKSDDDCLGEYWAGNEPLYTAAPAPAAPVDLSGLVEYERSARGSDGIPPYEVEDFYLAADVRALLAATGE